MKKVNKFIQLVVVIIGVVIALASIFDAEMLFYLMFWTMPLGFTQYVASVIDAIIYKGKSVYFIHLIVSTIVLIILFSGAYFNVNISSNSDEILIGICGFACFCLAIYFWILTFRSEEIVMTEHNVLDL